MDFVRLSSESRFVRACPVWFAAHPLGVGAAIIASGAWGVHAGLFFKVCVLALALSAVSIFTIRVIDRAFGASSVQARAGWPGLNLVLLGLVIVAHRAWVEPVVAQSDGLREGFIGTWGASSVASFSEVVVLASGMILLAFALVRGNRRPPRATAAPAGPDAPLPPPPDSSTPGPAPAPPRPRTGSAAAAASASAT